MSNTIIDLYIAKKTTQLDEELRMELIRQVRDRLNFKVGHIIREKSKVMIDALIAENQEYLNNAIVDFNFKECLNAAMVEAFDNKLKEFNIDVVNNLHLRLLDN